MIMINEEVDNDRDEEEELDYLHFRETVDIYSQGVISVWVS